MGEKERVRNREALKVVANVILTEENIETAGNWFIRFCRKIKEKVRKGKEK